MPWTQLRGEVRQHRVRCPWQDGHLQRWHGHFSSRANEGTDMHSVFETAQGLRDRDRCFFELCVELRRRNARREGDEWLGLRGRPLSQDACGWPSDVELSGDHDETRSLGEGTLTPRVAGKLE